VLHRENKVGESRIFTYQAIIVGVLLLASIVIVVVNLSNLRNPVDDQNVGDPSVGTRPNIVLLGGDGLKASHLSVYGYGLDTTPFLREFSNGGLMAENHFSNAASSGGSVASMLTGKLPTETGVIYPPDILVGIDAFQHLPGILKRHGYQNIEIAVSHYADAYDLNIQNGFDKVNFRSYEGSKVITLAHHFVNLESVYFLSQLRQRISDRIFHIYFIHEMINPYAEVTNPTPASSVDDRRRIDELLTQLSEIEAPVFAHVHMMGTHGPIFFPRKRVFSKGIIQDQRWMDEFYDDAILDFDEYVREVIERLTQMGELDNTIVIIYSDHGMLYKTDERIPLIIRFPDAQFTGHIRSNTQNLDIAPTILDYLGILQPNWMSGRSLIDGEPERLRHILSAAWNPRNLTKGDTGAWVVDIDRVKPPFYQLGFLELIQCQMHYELDLIHMKMFRDSIEGHTNPCEESELSGLYEIEESILGHLEESGYDVSVLPQPLPIADRQGRATSLPAGASPWTITTNIPEDLWEVGITRLLNPGLVQLRFPVDDPGQGDYVAVSQTVPVQVGYSYDIALELWDPYDLDTFPGIFEQRLYFNDQLVWSHDVSGDKSSGWQQIQINYQAHENELVVRAELTTIGQPEIGINWGAAVGIALRNLETHEADDSSG
jgi:hypothetical protein